VRGINPSSRLSAVAVALLLIPVVLGAKTFHGEGLVTQVDPGRHKITISHRDIPGFMPAMEMPFTTDEKEDLQEIKPGMRIMFDLMVDKHQMRVRKIRVIQNPPPPGSSFAPKPATRELQAQETVPNFSLVAQDGSEFELSSLRGRVVLIDFIYTRCPTPEACPRLSANFAYLQRHFGNRIDLISVTLDPKWDKPGVLDAYAKRWAADTSTWRFATGPESEVRRLAEEFGVRYWPDEDALVPSSAVGIIARDGRLAARVDGAAYPVRQLMDLVTAQLSLDSPPPSP
jgi:protein SCO1